MHSDKNTSNEKLDCENETQQAASHESFHIRPGLSQKFRPADVSRAIHNILHESMYGKEFSADDLPILTKQIAGRVRDCAREFVSDMEFSRYKLMAQVVIGEQHGAGVKIGARCMWDAETDCYACAEFQTDTLFCMAAVFAVYVY